MQRSFLLGIALAVLTGSATETVASPSDLQCQSTKNKINGYFLSCLAKAEAKAALDGSTADFGPCLDRFAPKWDDAEARGAGTCPDNVATASSMSSYMLSEFETMADIVAGTAPIPSCGDGAVNAIGEHCDGADLDGYSCVSLGFAGGTLGCSGSCDFDASSCSATCAGFEYGGACWFRADNISCDAACANAGLAYDSATLTVAGSGGTDLACQAVLDGIGAAGTGSVLAASSFCGSMGCSVAVNGPTAARIRCFEAPTSSSAFFFQSQRACACH